MGTLTGAYEVYIVHFVHSIYVHGTYIHTLTHHLIEPFKKLTVLNIPSSSDIALQMEKIRM